MYRDFVTYEEKLLQIKDAIEIKVLEEGLEPIENEDNFEFRWEVVDSTAHEMAL